MEKELNVKYCFKPELRAFLGATSRKSLTYELLSLLKHKITINME